MKANILFCILTCLILAAAPQTSRASSPERHMLVVVWDGMRPDFISESNTPNLFAMASRGVRFANHHPVYISTTEVNGTAIATGTYPGYSDIEANTEYRPLINSTNSIHTEGASNILKGDQLTHGHYIEAPTTAEIVRRKKGLGTAIAGAKGVALLHDRAQRGENSENVILYAGETLPASFESVITGLHGAFPSYTNKSPTRNDWTTDALINPLWKKGLPAFNLLWISEPDATQHATGPGSPKSLVAIRNADDNLGKVEDYLSANHLLDKTDILLVSDHGFSTIESIVDAAESLRVAGFKAYESFNAPPTNGEIMVVPLGGSVLFYVIGHEQTLTQKLVDFLQNWQATGVIFTPSASPGTFAMSQFHLDSKDKPDVIVSLRWNDGLSNFKTPGMLACNASSYHPGQGMHGSLSRFDMHNTFVAAGPDFKAGIVDELPTGNVDVAPTALHLLGISIPDSMKGRVVSEALVAGGPRLRQYKPEIFEATRNLNGKTWRQYVQTATVNETIYFDEGNGELK